MFNSPKQTTSTASDNFGEEFIHTMKDDLHPSLKSALPKSQSIASTDKEQDAIRKQTPPSLSPFLDEKQIQQPVQPFIQPMQAPQSIEPKPTPPPSPIQPRPVPTPIQQSSYELPSESFAPPKFTPPAPRAASITPIPSMPPLQKSPLAQRTLPMEKKSSLGLILIITGIIVLLLLIIGGGYYFYQKNNSGVVEQEQENVDEEIITEEPESVAAPEETVKLTPLSEKYYEDKVNIITVDIETMGPDELKRSLSNTAREVSQLQSREPYEFIINDTKGNRVAFPIFAIASEIKFPQTLLSNLDEDFTFYVYNDQGNTRTGLVIETKNSEAAFTEMKNLEADLTKIVSFLFLYENYMDKTGPYNSNIYNGIPSRYLNLDATNSISIDFGIYKNMLVIGTSKDTFWAILDKLLLESNTTSTTTGNAGSYQNTPANATFSGY